MKVDSIYLIIFCTLVIFPVSSNARRAINNSVVAPQDLCGPVQLVSGNAQCLVVI